MSDSHSSSHTPVAVLTEEESITAKLCTFFHVDDCEDELYLVHELAARCALPFDIRQFDSAAAFLAHVERESETETETAGAGGSEPPPAFLLLDYDLRPATAPEVIARVKALGGGWKHLPIIVYSNSLEADDAARAYEAGADHFFVKPLQVTRVRAILQALLGCATSPDKDYSALGMLPERVEPVVS